MKECVFDYILNSIKWHTNKNNYIFIDILASIKMNKCHNGMLLIGFASIWRYVISKLERIYNHAL